MKVAFRIFFRLWAIEGYLITYFYLSAAKYLTGVSTGNWIDCISWCYYPVIIAFFKTIILNHLFTRDKG